MSTDSPLYRLNKKHDISAPENSVPVTKLIRVHQPRNRTELFALFKSHVDCECECGIKSKGTIKDFGVNLYNAQIDEWGQHIFTLKECIQWEFDFFLLLSGFPNGNTIVEKAILYIRNFVEKHPEYQSDGFWAISKCTGNHGVDILVSPADPKREVYPFPTECYIKVEPKIYKYMEGSIKRVDETCDGLFNATPVFCLYYDEDSKFINFDNVIELVVNRSME